MVINFKLESMQNSEDYYKKIHMVADQNTVITQMAQFLCQFLPIPERPMKGFIWRALTDWQVKNRKDLSEVLKISPDQRVETVLEIIALLKKHLTRILISQEQEPLLNESCQKAVKFYKTKFAGR
ncbi:MAG: hypothetical protein ACFFCE_18700 [Promethearchaeota archaeon]